MASEKLQQVSTDNWNKIPKEKRDLCLNHLRTTIPETTMAELKKYWDAAGFHFAGGMWIRNKLREVMADDELPGIFYKDAGAEMHNWDDFYMGALEELLKDVKAKE